MTDLTHEITLQLIRDGLKKQGDMPIFNTSMNRIQAVGSDPDSDAVELSVEIMKDVNLSTKVLKLANSPLYNRGKGKIGQLSRAVVVLGFGPIKNAAITAKFIDGFQRECPGINMTGMLVNSFLAGTFVRDVAAKCGINDIEQAYICGMLNNLGEIVTAFVLPEQYRQIKHLQKEENLSSVDAEQQVLGTTLRALGQSIAREWEFPLNVVNTMEDKSTGKAQRIRNQADLTGALVTLANKTMSLLYADNPTSDKSMTDLMYELSKAAGLRKEDVSASLVESFKQSCDLAKSYGLDKKHLSPKLRNNDDEELDKVAREFSFYTTSQLATKDTEVGSKKEQARDDDASDVNSEDPPAVIASSGDSNVLLNILFELTTMIAQKGNFNSILAKILEGMNLGIGYERVVLCLLSPDHKSYIGRLSSGDGAADLKDYLNFPVNTKSDLFSKVIMESDELFVENIDQSWREQLPEDFEAKTGARSFMLGTLHSKARPLGVFYADNARSGTPIDQNDQRSFMQLVAQAQLALQVR